MGMDELGNSDDFFDEVAIVRGWDGIQGRRITEGAGVFD